LPTFRATKPTKEDRDRNLMAHDNKRVKLLPFSKGKLINCNATLTASISPSTNFLAIKENSISTISLYNCSYTEDSESN